MMVTEWSELNSKFFAPDKQLYKGVWLAFICRVDRERQVAWTGARVDGWELEPDLCRTTRA